jgi:hypothetical protein
MSYVDNCTNCNQSSRLCKCHSVIDIASEEEEWDIDNPPPEQAAHINAFIDLAIAKEEALNLYGKIKTFCERSWIPIMDNLTLDDIYNLFYQPEIEFEDECNKGT